MKVHKDIEHLPHFEKAVITIGTFDGVHQGHQQIIALLKEEARRIGGETVIITFDPHPRKVLRNDTVEIKLITTIEERIGLLSGHGIDHLVIVPFTQEFSTLSPEDYVENFLVSRFHPHTVIIGYDHRFGQKRLGDYKLLEEYSRTGFFHIREIPQHLIHDVAVSSTRIREALNNGEIEKANELLGYDFFFLGTVTRGDQRGRTIGFPTANLKLSSDEKILPANGVYAVKTILSATDNRIIKGMMNIGFRPTVDGSTKTIEVNLFDFSEDIYGEQIRVSVQRFLRKEQKFSGIEALKEQLEKDRMQASMDISSS